MAESAVLFLFEKLSVFIAQEVSLQRGVRIEVEKIKQELDTMRAWLKDADRRKDSSEEMKTWLGQVREATYDVEDIIEEFFHRMDRPRRGGIRGFVPDTIRFLKNICDKHRFATKLKETYDKVHPLFERRVTYGLKQIEGSSSYDANKMWGRGLKQIEGSSSYDERDAQTSLLKEDDDIVGMKTETDLIVQWLVEGEQQRTVISVTGMGGMGKTALVTKAYKNQQVKKHFNCYACVSVSQTLKIDELLGSITKQLLEAMKKDVPNDLATKGVDELRQMVRGLLESKRYLIVLDDIWTMDAWNQLSVIFSDNRCGSRLLVTTRDTNLASLMGKGRRVCKLQPLHERDAWVLFCKKAFGNEPCPSELEKLAGSIVEKCGGLPLAIIAMGSLLSLRDKTTLEWKGVYENLSWQFQNNEMLDPVKQILLLSFCDLPYRLKHCLLYCCAFPEDYMIRCRQLIRLWVAEGFLQETSKITMEEAAEEYLKELIHRNMLQVYESDRFEMLKTCRMHDMVREVALSICEEERFFMTYDEQQAKRDDKVRHVSIYNTQETIQSSMGMPRLRSLMVFDQSMSFSSSLNMMASSFRLLRVLNLDGVPIESLPDELTNLFNLRYLNLKRTNVSELPKSFGRLLNLQTLDVRHTRVRRLPESVVKLRKLRHIFGYQFTTGHLSSFDYFESIQIPIGICGVTSLQSLQAVEGEEGKIVRQVGNLTQLRRLSISKVRAIDGGELCVSVGKMKHLLKLIVTATTEEETLELEALSSNPPELLQKLLLNGRLEKVPQWFNSLVNLTHLGLNCSKLREEDLLSSLHALPNLIEISLQKAYEGQELCFRDGWFLKLRIIYLGDLTQLNRIVLEKGALRSIQMLVLAGCGELKTLPEGIEYLTGLQQLILLDMPKELTERLQSKDGRKEDRRKVGHIPLIVRAQMTEEGLVREILN